jgi:hypothetical protein
VYLAYAGRGHSVLQHGDVHSLDVIGGQIRQLDMPHHRPDWGFLQVEVYEAD